MLTDAADQEFGQGTMGTAYHYRQVRGLTLKGLKAEGDLTAGTFFIRMSGIDTGYWLGAQMGHQWENRHLTSPHVPPLRVLTVWWLVPRASTPRRRKRELPVP